jgi:hypothetical protein
MVICHAKTAMIIKNAGNIQHMSPEYLMVMGALAWLNMLATISHLRQEGLVSDDGIVVEALKTTLTGFSSISPSM